MYNYFYYKNYQEQKNKFLNPTYLNTYQNYNLNNQNKTIFSNNYCRYPNLIRKPLNLPYQQHNIQNETNKLGNQLSNNDISNNKSSKQQDTIVSLTVNSMLQKEKEDDQKPKNDSNIENNNDVNNNLLFGERDDISPFKLYLHLSEKTEIILMIIATIASLASGIAAPLLCYLFGDVTNDFNGVNIDDEEMQTIKKIMNSCNNEECVKNLALKETGGNDDLVFTYVYAYNSALKMFGSFDNSVDSAVKKILIIGASMFVAFTLQKFLWCYVGMKQINHLKEKYFAIILKQEQGWFDANNAYEFSTKVQAQFE